MIEPIIIGPATLYKGDCLDVMRTLPDNSVDSIVTDPPYGLGFMGKRWDHGVPSAEIWREALRVLKPGGYLLAFAGTRTQHRMAVNIEDAGFEIRDQIMWVFGSGFPKSHSVAKAINPMIELRYGKEAKCDCLDHLDGRHARNDGGCGGGETARIQRAASEPAQEDSRHPVVSIDVDCDPAAMRELQQDDSTQGAGSSSIQETLLLERMCSGRTEAPGHGHAALRSGLEKQAGGNSGARQSVSRMRQNARSERDGAACTPSETISSGRHESASEPRSAVRDMPSSNRGDNRTGFVIDPNRHQARRVVCDDQCGWPTAVANVCSWCGCPDQGWLDSIAPLGTALKPAHEPICVARKPLIGTVAQNVLQHGTGAINIDGCRVPGEPPHHNYGRTSADTAFAGKSEIPFNTPPLGRWPANLIHDGSDEVLEYFPDSNGQQGAVGPQHGPKDSVNTFGDYGPRELFEPRNDAGSAARFFYCPKASREDRNEGLEGLPERISGMVSNTSGQHITRRDGGAPGPRANHHPTVKPTDLMRYLCRLVTPPGGVVLDPFLGSGSTGKAAILEGFRFIGIEQDEDEDGNSLGYIDIAGGRIQHAIKTLAENTSQQRLFA